MKISDIGRFLLSATPHARAQARVDATARVEKTRMQGALEVARIVNDARIADAQKRYAEYPVMGMTQALLDTLPTAGSMEIGFLATCPLHSWFICEKDPLLPTDAVIVGQVVAGADLSAAKLVIGLSVPNRGVNLYRLAII